MSEKEETDPEILYYRAIEKFVTDQGFYLALLELQGTDEEYCIATLKAHKSAFLIGTSSKVIAALTLESVAKYNTIGREFAIAYISAVERRLKPS
jgi:hypothetical protein